MVHRLIRRINDYYPLESARLVEPKQGATSGFKPGHKYILLMPKVTRNPFNEKQKANLRAQGFQVREKMVDGGARKVTEVKLGKLVHQIPHEKPTEFSTFANTEMTLFLIGSGYRTQDHFPIEGGKSPDGTERIEVPQHVLGDSPYSEVTYKNGRKFTIFGSAGKAKNIELDEKERERGVIIEYKPGKNEKPITNVVKRTWKDTVRFNAARALDYFNHYPTLHTSRRVRH